MLTTNLFSPDTPSANSPRNSPSLAGVIAALQSNMVAVQQSLYEGYFREAATSTYSSANSFTVSGDVRARYKVGTPVRFNNNNDLVGLVISASYGTNTLITLTGVTVPTPITSVDIGIVPKGSTTNTLSGMVLDTPIITDPEVSDGVFTGGIFTSPSITTPTISNPSISDGTFTNAILNTPTINNPTIKSSKILITDLGTISGSTVLNMAAANEFLAVPGANFTLVPSNIAVGRSFILRLGAGYTVTWWSTIRWDDDTAPTRTTTAGKYDLFQFSCIKDLGGGSYLFDGAMIGRNRS